MNTSISKTRASTLISTRKIISGEHLNANGTLFGGNLMAWIDDIAFICARRFTGAANCVTVNIDQITFRSPVRTGEHLIISAVINNVGTSSMDIEVSVEREAANNTDSLTRTNSAHLTFVCLDSEFKKLRVPDLILESSDDRLKCDEAKLRAKVRRRLSKYLDRSPPLNPASEIPAMRSRAKWRLQRALVEKLHAVTLAIEGSGRK